VDHRVALSTRDECSVDWDDDSEGDDQRHRQRAQNNQSARVSGLECLFEILDKDLVTPRKAKNNKPAA